jgi:hypothetical protein
MGHGAASSRWQNAVSALGARVEKRAARRGAGDRRRGAVLGRGGAVSREEARIVIQRLMQVIDDLRDLDADGAPQHVMQDRERHIETLQEAAADLRNTYKVSV